MSRGPEAGYDSQGWDAVWPDTTVFRNREMGVGNRDMEAALERKAMVVFSLPSQPLNVSSLFLVLLGWLVACDGGLEPLLSRSAGMELLCWLVTNPMRAHSISITSMEISPLSVLTFFVCFNQKQILDFPRCFFHIFQYGHVFLHLIY